MTALVLPTTETGDIILTAEQAAAIMSFHREAVKLMEVADSVLAAVSLTYDSAVANDASLTVGPIGRTQVYDLRRLRRRIAQTRRTLTTTTTGATTCRR